MNHNSKELLPHPYLLAVGVLLVFFGVRLHLIMAYGSQTPYWDDWMMGTRMAMYMESGFDFSWLYGVVNSHRSTFSKLTNFFFFELNDQQWDPYLTMVYDAFLWAVIGSLLLFIGSRERSTINYWLFALVVTILWTYPLSIFNTLSTVQTYVYYKVLFVVGGFWLITDRAFSAKWAFGMFLVGAACLTTAGGSMTPAAAAATFLLLALFIKQNRVRNAITAGLALTLAVFGMYLIFSQANSGASSPGSIDALLSSLLKILSWPNSEKKWPSVIFLLPMVLLALGIIRKKIRPSRLAVFTLLLSTFSVMLAFALAYARGADGKGPSERYFDFLSLYLVASALALLVVCNSNNISRSLYKRTLVVLWVAMCVMAIPYHISVTHFQLNDRAKLVPVQTDIMTRYSVTHDPELFKNRAFREVPFPSSKTLEDMVKRLEATDVIPYTLQPSTSKLSEPNGAFIKNGVRHPKHGRYRRIEEVIGSYNSDRSDLPAMGEYQSEVFTAKRPYLMVPVSGFLGGAGTSLTLVGEENGRIVDVIPKITSVAYSNKWQEVLVKAPDTKYRVVAKDESSSLWFAFAEPRSVGRLSYFVNRLINIGDKVWLVGLLILLLAFRQQVFAAFSHKARHIEV